MERTPLLEVEIKTPCTEGKTHPVRIALYGWGEFEVVQSPCKERLGGFSDLAPCQEWLNDLDNWFHHVSFVQQRLALVEQLERSGADALPVLIQVLQDTESVVRAASAQALGNLKNPTSDTASCPSPAAR